MCPVQAVCKIQRGFLKPMETPPRYVPAQGSHDSYYYKYTKVHKIDSMQYVTIKALVKCRSSLAVNSVVYSLCLLQFA